MRARRGSRGLIPSTLILSARFFPVYSLIPHLSSLIFLLHPNNRGPHIFFIPRSPTPPPSPTRLLSPYPVSLSSLLFPSSASRTDAGPPLPPLIFDLPAGGTDRRGARWWRRVSAAVHDVAGASCTTSRGGRPPARSLTAGFPWSSTWPPEEAEAGDDGGGSS